MTPGRSENEMPRAMIDLLCDALDVPGRETMNEQEYKSPWTCAWRKHKGVFYPACLPGKISLVIPGKHCPDCGKPIRVEEEGWEGGSK